MCARIMAFFSFFSLLDFLPVLHRNCDAEGGIKNLAANPYPQGWPDSLTNQRMIMTSVSLLGDLIELLRNESQLTLFQNASTYLGLRFL